ncbi:glycosyltransferase family 2 protein [Nonlabens sp. Asnod3-A02]|uniref:glycosyltransferase family 2 protein n=1 Tax=Nonlabens sp. Asnod3-A02 TaxID=3160579 RepID=UPI003867F3A6
MIRVSFLITHYNRPHDLVQCVNAINKIACLEDEIVVSDDFSSSENLEIVKGLKVTQLILADKNTGLASNLNRGITQCRGKYILYCQEDFILNLDLKFKLNLFLEVLDRDIVEMLRLKTYISFKKMIELDTDLSIIPTFSWCNFLTNPYRYSDHPFLVKNDFFRKNGLYLENTSGGYGETEYAIRLAHAKTRIGMTYKSYASVLQNSNSVMVNEVGHKPISINMNKKVIRFLRVTRLYFEWILYSDQKRGLITYKNQRKS